MNVFENVALPLREKTKLSEDEIRARVADALEKVGLDPDGAAYPSDLSGGMQKRTGLARAIVTEPEILLSDEPTSGLDPVSARAFDRLVLELRDALGVTIFQITHDLDSIFGASDLVVFLARKKVLAVGTAEELAQRPEPELRAYFSARAGE